MNATFENLEPEKKDRIIQACLTEFAENGYIKASTNNMVKAAGISKGLLFHYFGNKQQLYIYLFRQVADKFIRWFWEGFEDQSPDLLDRFMQWTIRKLQLFRSNPLVYQFNMTALQQDLPSDVKSELAKLQIELTATMSTKLFEGIDFSKIRDGVEPQKAVQFVLLALDARAQQFVSTCLAAPDLGMSSFDEMVNELRESVDLIRFGIYKQ